MIPHEKAMVDRLQSKSFALIGINSDGDRDTLKTILEKQGITWRQAVDGSTSGPIASRWNVSGWPTIYVIDAHGVIRFRDLREKQLEDAVVKLLGEGDSPTQR
jgi:hypothetical protein